MVCPYPLSGNEHISLYRDRLSIYRVFQKTFWKRTMIAKNITSLAGPEELLNLEKVKLGKNSCWMFEHALEWNEKLCVPMYWGSWTDSNNPRCHDKWSYIIILNNNIIIVFECHQVITASSSLKTEQNDINPTLIKHPWWTKKR